MIPISLLLSLSTMASAGYQSFPYTLCDASGCNQRNTFIYSTNPLNATGSTISMGAGRSYIVNPEQTAYEPFFLMNRQLSITTDISKVGCGQVASAYFNEMALNSAVGKGYCDSQSTCNEMDVFEGNIGGSALTPHPCKYTGQSNSGTCHKVGCGTLRTESNPNVGPNYSWGIDTLKPYTMTTQWHTNDGTDTGYLVGVSQVLTQGSKTVDLGTITNSTCSNLPFGGLTSLGNGLDQGMVMVFSVWTAGNSSWLDGGAAVNPKCIFSTPDNPDKIAKFSNIKLEHIPVVPVVAKGTTTTTKKITTTTKKTTTTTKKTTTTTKKTTTTTKKTTTTTKKNTATTKNTTTTTKTSLSTTTTKKPTTSTTTAKKSTTSTTTTKPTTSTTATKKTTTTSTKRSTTTTSTAAAPKTTTTTANVSACSSQYGQCGGLTYKGPTCCVNSVCKYDNAYYSQCVPSN